MMSEEGKAEIDKARDVVLTVPPQGLPSLLADALPNTLILTLVALSIASLVAGILRLRGNGGVPPQEGGWRELRVPGS
jgi:predicted NAD/FAD-dependent oxidoreductase